MHSTPQPRVRPPCHPADVAAYRHSLAAITSPQNVLRAYRELPCSEEFRKSNFGLREEIQRHKTGATKTAVGAGSSAAAVAGVRPGQHDPMSHSIATVITCSPLPPHAPATGSMLEKPRDRTGRGGLCSDHAASRSLISRSVARWSLAAVISSSSGPSYFSSSCNVAR